MDENQIQELQPTNWFNKYNQLPKKAFQFLVSLSLFSFLFLSFSSSPSSQFSHYLKFHSSTLLFPIVSQALDRKFIFLLCNGIVAFLAKSLSFTTNSTPSPDFTEDVVKAVAGMDGLVDHKESTVGCAMEPLEEEIEEEEEAAEVENSEPLIPPPLAEDEVEDEEAEVEEIEPLIPPPSAEDEEADEEVGVLEESGPLIPSPSAEDEGNELNMGTEELNRKIEEFIRKMKEEIRIEAKKQPLVLCNAHA